MLLNQINGYHHDLVYNTLSSGAQASKDMGTKLGPTLVFYTISERFFDSHNWAFLYDPKRFFAWDHANRVRQKHLRPSIIFPIKIA
jgi:hypothetical protein